MIAPNVVADMMNLVGLATPLEGLSKNIILPHQAQWCWIGKSLSKVSDRGDLWGKVELNSSQISILDFTVFYTAVEAETLNLEVWGYLFKQFWRNCHGPRRFDLRQMNAYILQLLVSLSISTVRSHFDILQGSKLLGIE
jgi:hypothetical protein